MMRTLTTFINIGGRDFMQTNQDEFINNGTGYTVGLLLAIFLLGYLVYTLFKPEKF